jgi:hypothetical protein
MWTTLFDLLPVGRSSRFLPCSVICCGLFGAAPSVALATLTLAFWKEGPEYVAAEGRSMVLGALGLALDSIVVCQLMVRARMSALTATICAMAVWLAGALSLKQLLVG